MSGVIDENGQQWERCGRCAGFVEIESMLYEQPSEQFQFGRDLCRPCNLALKLGEPTTLPKEKLKDQLSEEEAREISERVRKQIEEHGLEVRVMAPDGTWSDASIPPKEVRS